MSKVAVPKPQAYPASVIVPGAVLWSVLAWTDEDTGKTGTEYEEWHVRSIRAKRGSKSQYGRELLFQGDTRQRVNLSRKLLDISWVKTKGKLGWAPSIPEWLTKQFVVGNTLPDGIYTTQRAALVYAIRSHQAGLKKYDEWLEKATSDAERAEIAEWRAEDEAEIRALTTRFTKQFGKGK